MLKSACKTFKREMQKYSDLKVGGEGRRGDSDTCFFGPEKKSCGNALCAKRRHLEVLCAL